MRREWHERVREGREGRETYRERMRGGGTKTHHNQNHWHTHLIIATPSITTQTTSAGASVTKHRVNPPANISKREEIKERKKKTRGDGQ